MKIAKKARKKEMYELVQAAGNSYYIESPAKIGLVQVSGTEAVLIDSGSDKDAGKKALRHLQGMGVRRMQQQCLMWRNKSVLH